MVAALFSFLKALEWPITKKVTFDMMESSTAWPCHKALNNQKCIKGFQYVHKMIYLSTQLQKFGTSYTLK